MLLSDKVIHYTHIKLSKLFQLQIRDTNKTSEPESHIQDVSIFTLGIF